MTAAGRQRGKPPGMWSDAHLSSWQKLHTEKKTVCTLRCL